MSPQVVTLSEDQMGKLVEAVQGVAEKVKDGAKVAIASHHFTELSGKMQEVLDQYSGVRREMTGILDAAVEATIENARRGFEQIVTDTERRITTQLGKVEGAISGKLNEAKALIDKLSKARVTMDPRSIAELMTHVRPLLFQAVAEAREHLAAYIIDDIRNGIGAVVGAEVRKALGDQPAQSTWLQKLSYWCSVLGFILLAAGATAVWYATKNFKPPVLDFKFDKDGKLVPAPETAEAIRRHTLDFQPSLN